MKTYLRIKGLSLAAEARIIKKIEQNRRTNKDLRAALHHHRTVDVRNEARATNLARGFIRGLAHHHIEQPLRPLNEGHISTTGYTRTHPNWDRVFQLVKKYGLKYFYSEQEMAQKFAEWRDHAIGVK